MSSSTVTPSAEYKKIGRPSLYDRKISALAISASSMAESQAIIGLNQDVDRSNQSVSPSDKSLLGVSTVDERVFTCEMCQKTFPGRASLKSHQRVHNLEKPFACTALECSKKFRTQSDRARHVRTHTGVKAYECGQCSATFSNSNNLKTHKSVVHLGVKPYTCDTCSKAFGYLTNYRNHLRTHTGEKPYICSHIGCKQTFGEYSIALRHALYVHTPSGSFQCSKCEKVYRSQSGLTYHAKVMHREVALQDAPQLQPLHLQSGPSRFTSTSLLRELILQELPRFANLIRNDGSFRHLQSALEDEREAAILLGFYEEESADEVLGAVNAEISSIDVESNFTAVDPSSDWNMDGLHSRELDLFPELATDTG